MLLREDVQFDVWKLEQRSQKVLTVGVLLLGKGEDGEHEHEEHLERTQQFTAHGTLLNTHGFRRVKADRRL